MKITKIEPQKKNKNRMSVFIDGVFSFGIDAFSLYSLKLAENDELDSARLAEIKNTVLLEQAKTYAAKLISARSYTERAIRKKLSDHIGDSETVEKTIGFLKEYRMIDDRDYARRFAADCMHLRKLGSRQIKYKLMEKGICASLAEQTIEELGCQEKEAETLLTLMEKKLGGDFDTKNILKARRYFAYRGYSFDDIDTAIQKLKAERDA
ncbi:MAG: RecX family transcriptional regulator [Clostridia bacterium]|nr:RecX family transcriptional regulator [Clostridia bacterium]